MAGDRLGSHVDRLGSPLPAESARSRHSRWISDAYTRLKRVVCLMTGLLVLEEVFALQPMGAQRKLLHSVILGGVAPFAVVRC